MLKKYLWFDEAGEIAAITVADDSHPQALAPIRPGWRPIEISHEEGLLIAGNDPRTFYVDLNEACGTGILPVGVYKKKLVTLEVSAPTMKREGEIITVELGDTVEVRHSGTDQVTKVLAEEHGHLPIRLRDPRHYAEPVSILVRAKPEVEEMRRDLLEAIR